MTQVAQIIKQQLGLELFFLMGAYDLTAFDNALGFKIQGSQKCKHIKITLNADDEYDVTFSNWSTYDTLQEHTVGRQQWSDLKDLIESETDLFVSLHPRKKQA